MDVVAVAQEYLNGNGVSSPFLVAFDASEDLKTLTDALSSCETIRVSDFCPSADALPDLDALGNRLTQMKGKALLLGIGEYAALSGDSEALSWIFGRTLPHLRVVVPIWNGFAFLEDASRGDPRVLGRRGWIFAKTGKHWSLRIFREGLVTNTDAIGFKALLRHLEDGCDLTLNAVTSVVPLTAAWCRQINSAHDIYRERHPQSSVPRVMFTEEQWAAFLDENHIRGNAISSPDRLLKLLEEGAGENSYLALALSKTKYHSEWKRTLLCALLDVPVGDRRFARLYAERKALVPQFDLADMMEYLHEARRIIEPFERLRYMTDCTTLEREAIVRLLGEIGDIPATLETVYPALWDYWQRFTILGDGFPATLTQYVQDYKRQKVLGRIEPGFLETVRDFAEDRPQFFLPTRESVLENLDKEGVLLCWIDALGCEFLGFIRSVAERLGLKLKVTLVRVKLPSITSVNRAFYDAWQGEKMEPVSKLDKIKHGDFERYDTSPTSAGIALPYELLAVEDAIKKIAAQLHEKPGSKVILTSDHGTTRLAVIYNRETIWELPEKGKHGGRCCRKSDFDGSLPPCVTESDDEKWHVLAGYDRFKGGRKGDVEVHGGATLEEMVVPIVAFELFDKSICVRLVEEEFKVTYRDKELTLQLFCASTLTSPSVSVGGTRTAAIADGRMGHYRATIPKPKMGDHLAVIYDGDTKIGEVCFRVKSGVAQIKTDNLCDNWK